MKNVDFTTEEISIFENKINDVFERGEYIVELIYSKDINFQDARFLKYLTKYYDRLHGVKDSYTFRRFRIAENVPYTHTRIESRF